MKLISKVHVLATGMLVFAATSTAFPISLSQSIDKTEMAFEDRAVFEITIEWSGQQHAFRFPVPLNPNIDRLKVEKFTSSISSTGQGEYEKTTKKFIYVLAPTSSGQGKVDPITVSYITWPDSVAGELITEQVIINIAEQRVSSKSSELPLWIPLTGVLLLLGSGAAIMASVSKAKKSKKPTLTPVDEALQVLSALKTETGSDMKRFQTGVYNLLSKFLKSKYNVEIDGLSDEKLEGQLSKSQLSKEDREAVKKWLIQAEKDKFRPMESSPGETVRLETELRRFFEKLK
jgi:hypothetical protein